MAQVSPCGSDVQLPSTTITSGASADYAANYISAGNGFVVNNNSGNSASVTFQAGSMICLGAGFHAVGGTAAVTFHALIATPTVPLAVTTSSMGWDVGVSGSRNLAATGGTAPYSGWVVVSGSLPAGLTLNAATGAISGAPTTPGTSTFSVTVQDRLGGVSAARSVSIVVGAALRILTTTLPNGKAGTAYTVMDPAPLAVGGGQSPYNWVVTSGTLPAGLTLSTGGAIVGTPTGEGLSTFGVTVQDSTGAVATQSLAIEVESNPANGSTPTATTKYTYDWMGNLTTSTMTRAGVTQTRTFVYDDAGRLTSATNPENGTVSYTYNTDNTLASKVDAKGQGTAYSYDSYKNVTEVQRYPNGMGGAEDQCQRVTYTYGTDPTQATLNRLITAAYGSMSGGYTDQNGNTGTCVPGTYATTYSETYTYVPAGGVASKTFAFTRSTGARGSAAVSYAYDSVGRTQSVQYAPADRTPGYNVPVAFTYGFDSMGRPSSLADDAGALSVGANTVWAQGVTYDYAGRMTQLQYPKSASVSAAIETETWSYSVVTGQLASIGWTDNWNTGTLTPVGGIQYSYSATQNNGQITQVTDTISGETITYEYDALKRLVSAGSVPASGSSTAAWTQAFSYDGFGNLTAKTLNGAVYPISINSATNQMSGPGYDANGNITEGGTIGYDVANRMFSYVATGIGTEYYGYAPDNKRIYRKLGTGGEEWTFFGAHGEKLGTWVYASRWDEATQANVTDFHASASNVWFAGRLISDGNLVCSAGNCTRAVFQDWLGTNRASGARFYPYGDEITSSSNDREKYGTYNRDSFTGFDYADQRYYASTYGRFNTVDPSSHSVHPKSPGSWNRYAYVGGDPVNHNDPQGLDQSVCTDPDDPDCPASPEPDPCWDLSLGLFDGSLNCGAPVTAPVASGDDGSSDGDSPPPCPPKFQAYINSYGAYATATGLSEANVLALSAIESDYGNGRFAKGGNSFFNLETLSPVGWQPGDPLPATKYVDQVSWMNALESFQSGPNAGRTSLVATYQNASDAFASFAATLGKYFSGVTNAASFGSIAVAHGIYAGRGNGFITTEQTFQNCLGSQ